MKKNTLHLGLDVHKETITIATAEGRRSGEVRVHGTISNDLHAIEKLLGKTRRAPSGRRARGQLRSWSLWGSASPGASRFPAWSA
ncbi:MAG TPA: hypothetical protein VIT91_15425 [Chthoniobacterales bacterium]